jgi:putative transposase
MYQDYQNIETTEGKHLMRVPYIEPVCKYCGSKNIIKWGHYHGRQRLFCKDCQRKFADNGALPEQQAPTEQVGAAIGMFYEGQSLTSVCRSLNQIYGSYPSDSTIYRWVSRYTNQAVKEAKEYHPKVSDTWHVDETVLKIGGRNVWFYDVEDDQTRFLLASHIATSRQLGDARLVLKRAEIKAGKKPKVVISDSLNSYPQAIGDVFGADVQHIKYKGLTKDPNNNILERFHGTLKDRTKVMRGLKDLETARLVTDGWLIYYNYLRPHESLENKTPAEFSGIAYPYKNWTDIIAGKRIIVPAQINSTSIYIPSKASDTLFIRHHAKPKHTVKRRQKLVPQKRVAPKKRVSTGIMACRQVNV